MEKEQTAKIEWEQPQLSPSSAVPLRADGSIMAGQSVDSGLPRKGEEPPRPISLEGLPVAWVDRLLPRSPRPFLVMVSAIAAGCWLLGLVLATDRVKFLAAKEWQAQPLFLACHLVALRLFVTVYARNFLAGAAHLNMPAGEPARRMHSLLRPLGGAVALLVAAPFCMCDFIYLYGEDYSQSALGSAGSVGAADLFMGLIWCVEWALNAYIWVLLAGFSVLLLRLLKRYPFRAPVEIVLHEKHYRPFLLMSVQGATILLVFGVAYACYIWYAAGVASDYLSLCITGTLLLIGFVPPWLRLKNGVERAVQAETYELRHWLSGLARDRADISGHDRASSLPELAARVEEAWAMLRIVYLERLQQELGQAEGKAILLRLLAPATTVAWKFLRPLFLGA
jgi:hypothetical protein